MSGWLEALLSKVFNSGVSIPLSKGINFTGGLVAALNPSTKQISVALDAAAVAPTHLAAEANGAAAVFVLRVALVAGTPGTADDVVGPAAPCNLRILDTWVDVTDHIAGATSLKFRTVAGGVGNTLSGNFSGETQGDGIRATQTRSTATLAQGALWYIRRQDRGVAGMAYMLCARV
jgi:hypothetical protein